MGEFYNHKEKTAHIHQSLKDAGVDARIRMFSIGGLPIVQIITTAYEVQFTVEELGIITKVAKVNGLTMPDGVTITVDIIKKIRGLNQFDFDYHSDLDKF